MLSVYKVHGTGTDPLTLFRPFLRLKPRTMVNGGPANCLPMHRMMGGQCAMCSFDTVSWFRESFALLQGCGKSKGLHGLEPWASRRCGEEGVQFSCAICWRVSTAERKGAAAGRPRQCVTMLMQHDSRERMTEDRVLRRVKSHEYSQGKRSESGSGLACRLGADPCVPAALALVSPMTSRPSSSQPAHSSQLTSK